MKWIIDTDFSTNSKKSLELLIKKNFDIIAITTTYGPSYKNPNEVKEDIEFFLRSNNMSNIPVYAGAIQPYINFTKEFNDEIIIDPYNLETLKNSCYDNKKVSLEESASLKIIELCKIHKKELNILTYSSLTNLSLSILLESNLCNIFNKMYVVGGSTTGISNSGNCSESNFRTDPVASKNVVLFFSNLILIPLEIENSIKNILSNKIEVNGKSNLVDLEYVKNVYIKNKSILQLVATLILINQGIIKNEIILPADVDITGKYSRGALSLEKYPWIESGTYSKINIIEELYTEKFIETIFS